VTVKDADRGRSAPEQREMLVDLMKAVVEALKRGARVNVDSPVELPKWYMDDDWHNVADSGKTHYIIAIPKVEHDAALGDFLKISWEVGAIGIIDGKRVPVFAGALTEAPQARISFKTGVGAAIVDSTPESKAAIVGSAMRAIFPELGPPLRYYINCFDIDPPLSVALTAQWPVRRELLLTGLLSQLAARSELRHSKEYVSPRDGARAACQDDADKRMAAARDADFLLRGVMSKPPATKLTVRVTVQNKPGFRRLQNELTSTPSALSPAFLRQVVDWASKYEGNSTWELSVCGRTVEFWGTAPNVDSFAVALATVFQEKLSIEVPSTINRRKCS
jgi:hypothetical protein